MARVSGRTDDMLFIRGVNVFPAEIERVLLTISELSPHYRIVVDRPEALDSLEIQVEVEAAVNWVGMDDDAALRRHAARLLESALGVSAAISIHPPGSLPRSEGKAQRVLDRRTL